MKKLSILILLIFLIACSNSRQEDLYTININGQDITVGYDGIDTLNSYIDSYTTFIDNKDKEVLDKIVVYVNDVNGNISIDGTPIGDSIAQTCTSLNGEYSNKENGDVCLLSKRVKKHDNYIIIYGDILNDDLDKVDRIEVYYKWKLMNTKL